MTAPVARALHTGEAATFAGDDVLDVLPAGPARELLDAARARAPRSPCRCAPAGGRSGLLTLFYAAGHAPTRRRRHRRPGRRRPRGPRPGQRPPVQRPAAARRGAAAQHAHRAAGARPRARSPSATCRRPRRRGSAATGTTRSCSRAARRCWSSATSSATTPRPRPPWASCAACCAGIATYSDARPGRGAPRRSTPPWRTLQLGTLATAAVARFEQTPEEVGRGVTRMRWANAGHLPPLVINADGSVAELAAVGRRPHARRGPDRAAARVRGHPGPRRHRAALHRRPGRAPRRRPRRRACSGSGRR